MSIISHLKLLRTSDPYWVFICSELTESCNELSLEVITKKPFPDHLFTFDPKKKTVELHSLVVNSIINWFSKNKTVNNLITTSVKIDREKQESEIKGLKDLYKQKIIDFEKDLTTLQTDLEQCEIEIKKLETLEAD